MEACVTWGEREERRNKTAQKIKEMTRRAVPLTRRSYFGMHSFAAEVTTGMRLVHAKGDRELLCVNVYAA